MRVTDELSISDLLTGLEKWVEMAPEIEYPNVKVDTRCSVRIQSFINATCDPVEVGSVVSPAPFGSANGLAGGLGAAFAICLIAAIIFGAVAIFLGVLLWRKRGSKTCTSSEVAPEQ